MGFNDICEDLFIKTGRMLTSVKSSDECMGSSKITFHTFCTRSIQYLKEKRGERKKEEEEEKGEEKKGGKGRDRGLW